jgi:hypothetical protein
MVACGAGRTGSPPCSASGADGRARPQMGVTEPLPYRDRPVDRRLVADRDSRALLPPDPRAATSSSAAA